MEKIVDVFFKVLFLLTILLSAFWLMISTGFFREYFYMEYKINEIVSCNDNACRAYAGYENRKQELVFINTTLPIGKTDKVYRNCYFDRMQNKGEKLNCHNLSEKTTLYLEKNEGKSYKDYIKNKDPETASTIKKLLTNPD